jgi:transcriptional regulator with XRE-family HTH domain
MKRLAQLRIKRGLTQSELGKAINLDGNSISRYERGIVKASIEIAERFAAHFNVPVDELLNGPTPTESEIRVIAKNSDEETRVEVEPMALTKEAKYIESVTLTPNKIGLGIVFSRDKPLREVFDAILADEKKIFETQETLYK